LHHVIAELKIRAKYKIKNIEKLKLKTGKRAEIGKKQPGAVLAPPLWSSSGGQESPKGEQSWEKFVSVICTDMQFLT